MADEVPLIDLLAEKLRLTPDLLQGPEMPGILANRPDGELVEVAGEDNLKWVRVGSYGSLESICQSGALLGFRLGIYVMPYFPASEAEPERLRSGNCNGVSSIINRSMQSSKLVGASALRKLSEEPTLLLTKVEEALRELSEMGCTDDKIPSSSYSDMRRAANLSYIRALMDEGFDPHDVILAMDESIHEEVYGQPSAFDPCKLELDSEDRRNFTSASLQKLTEGVTASNSKSELGRILHLEGNVAEEALSEVDSKLMRLLKDFEVRLKNHLSKMEDLASAQSVIGCGIPRYGSAEVPRSPPVSDGEVAEAHLPWSESTDEEQSSPGSSDGVIDASP